MWLCACDSNFVSPLASLRQQAGRGTCPVPGSRRGPCSCLLGAGVRARRGLQSRTLGVADDTITRGCSGLVGATRSCSCRNEQAGAGGASSCCSSAAFANHDGRRRAAMPAGVSAGLVTVAKSVRGVFLTSRVLFLTSGNSSLIRSAQTFPCGSSERDCSASGGPEAIRSAQTFACRASERK